jgi:2'-5' RNA ligase
MQAREQVRAFAAEVAPFLIQASGIELFPVTNVVYVEVGEGNAELRRMHNVLNTGALNYDEPYCYHPHITLAQDLEEWDLQRVHQLALQRWAEYGGSRQFVAERVTFVKYTPEAGWSDVEEFELGVVPVLEKRAP